MAVLGMKGLLVLTLGLAMAATSSAVVYQVGGTSGWTILGNINYTDWTSKQNFHVGDTIEFKYPPGIHNVLEVKKADYDSCTNSTPIATHTSGDDKIVIKSPGHRFFICGVPGHCAAGQKVNIRVLKTTRSSEAPSKAPAPASSASGAPSGSASSPPPAGASSTDTDSPPDAAGTEAPAPHANGAELGAAGGHRGAFAVVLAAVASMAMLQ